MLESDGIEGVVSAGTTVAGAALAGVGGVVEMSGLVVGVSSVSRPALVKKECSRRSPADTDLVRQATIDSSLHVDPTSHESLIASSRVTLACMPALGKITNVWQTGEIGAEQTIEVSTRRVPLVATLADPLCSPHLDRLWTS